MAMTAALWAQAELLVRTAQEPETARVMELGFNHGLSAYDAEFAALAAQKGVDLVTDDARLLRAVPGLTCPIDSFGR